MYLSKELVKRAYGKLYEIDSSEGKSRKEKVSGLRYLFATSELLKQREVEELDLSVENREVRKLFIEAVGEVIDIGERNYTKDFASEFGRHSDYGVGSNFFTTRLASSRSRVIEYPGRPAPLLILDEEKISIIDNLKSRLDEYYSIENIKAPLIIWLLRNTNFKVTVNIASPDRLLELITEELNNKYTDDLVSSIEPKLEKLAELVGSNEVFSEDKPELSELIVSQQVQAPKGKASPSVPKESNNSKLHVMVDNLDDDDEVLLITKKLLERGSKGIMFSGPPGTGKTWYALKIAIKLAESNNSRLERVQFHPSYSYEDFIEGMVSTGAIGSNEPLFKPKGKVFVNLCNDAKKDADNAYYLVIDEFTRGDPSKIFGELLTYIEADYRDVEFTLPYSEQKFSVPHNLVIFGTMNPYDKSVVDLDAAMERRFEVIEIKPSVHKLTEFLRENEIQGEILGKVIKFFNKLNSLSEHGFGHTYFKDLKDAEDFVLLWNHKFRFQLEKMFKFKTDAYDELKELYIDILPADNKDQIL
ncbi:AAA family ATPase [Vibrio parahaemolyticus]|uniref:McrB family protein n=1 Tax=Vibrio parahaemolyticus TaxID=670 RepID=UPI001E4B62A8|nr:AAA family ATPase [Vibrio parahaemolyticus]MCD1416924.1 AAA family ATPase [Vibrio parahaemolyticus]